MVKAVEKLAGVYKMVKQLQNKIAKPRITSGCFNKENLCFQLALKRKQMKTKAILIEDKAVPSVAHSASNTQA